MATRKNNETETEVEKPTEQTLSEPKPNTQVDMPSYLKAACRIPSSYPLGAPAVEDHLFINKNSTDSGAPIGATPTPGVFVFKYLPTYGVSTNSESALNRSSYHEFNIIRAEISGNRPYSPADHMIYRLCNSSLRDLYDIIARNYGLTREYAATNLYRPKHVLQTMGFDFDSWNLNRPEIYQWLITHETSLISFPTVPVGKIDSRRHVLNSVVFTDGEIESTQTYVMVPEAVYSYEVVDEVKGLSMRRIPATWPEVKALWDTLYNAFQNSSNIYTIASDIRRAFKDKIVTMLPAIPENYTVPYQKLDAFLTSGMNATCVTADDLTSFRIWEDINTGVVKCEPSITQRSQGGTASSDYLFMHPSVMLNHINSVESDPDETDLLLATRFKPVIRTSYPVEEDDGTGYKWTTLIDSMGTEIVTHFRIGTLNESGVLSVENGYTNTLLNTEVQDATSQIFNYVRFFGLLSNFDWHPPVYIAGTRSGVSTITRMYRFEDIQNYIPISDTQLTQIHDAYLLSQFGI